MNLNRHLRGLVRAGLCAPFLASCSVRSVAPPLEKPVLAGIPARLTAPCADPVAIPDRDLLLDETLRLWFQDRVEKSACQRRHGGLVEALAKRDGIQSEVRP